jgi:L-amino acid N-acyltransferase YncA
MTDSISIRHATPGDAEAIAAIYNVFVDTCTCTWQTVPDTVDYRRGWLIGRRREHPVFVAEAESGHVVAFASLSPYSNRGAFDHSAEVSIYIAEAAQGHGLGKRLMATLLESAKTSGLHLLVSRISGDQPASLALHTKCGFTESGRIPEMGFKFGRRHDLVHMHRLVNQ